MARIFEYCRAHPRGRASLSRRTEPRRRAGERSSPDPGDSRAELAVDEAQDCSTADLYILNKLYDVGLPLVVVADPDQAIYGFRGAATHALTSLAGRLGRHDLTHNWRSTTVICKVAATLRSDPARRAADIAVACHHDAPHPVIVYAGGDRDANTADFIGYATKLDISPGDCLVLAHAQTTLPKTYAGAATPPSSKAAYGRQLTVRSARAAGASWTQIGAALGTTKQSAWEAHSRWIDQQASRRSAYGHQSMDSQQAAAARALAGNPDNEAPA